MNEKIPINLDILKWARISIGYSLEEVAHKIGKKFKSETIQSWENGDSFPTYIQLEQLAHNVYKRPIAVFFFPDVPKEESIKTDFRSLPELITDKLQPQIIKLYRKAKVFQFYLEDLYENEKPVNVSILDLVRTDSGYEFPEIINRIRGLLDISVDIQSTWRSTKVAFKEWRKALENKGIFIFKDSFRIDQYSGFCLYHDRYPIIYVNNSFPNSRQIFTLFHELAHLLYQQGGVYFRDDTIARSFQGRYSEIEVFCNRFSNELLVPPEIFNSFKLEISENQFEKLAQYFSVSREVILRNYLDRGLVDSEYYEKMVSKWSEQAEIRKETSGGSYYLNQKAYLGDNYVDLVFSKYYQNKISIENVADYLYIKIKNIPTFELELKERS